VLEEAKDHGQCDKGNGPRPNWRLAQTSKRAEKDQDSGLPPA